MCNLWTGCMSDEDTWRISWEFKRVTVFSNIWEYRFIRVCNMSALLFHRINCPINCHLEMENQWRTQTPEPIMSTVQLPHGFFLLNRDDVTNSRYFTTSIWSSCEGVFLWGSILLRGWANFRLQVSKEWADLKFEKKHIGFKGCKCLGALPNVVKTHVTLAQAKKCSQ